MELNLFKVSQPIGSFYITSIKAKDIKNILITNRREHNSGIQRELSKKRIAEIVKYTSDPDATFPTPIIISVSNSIRYSLIPIKEIKNLYKFEFNLENSQILGEIIDGQHRYEALIASSYIDDFELPIVFMFELTEEEKAYVFSIINSKQTKVNSSVIYDLFEVFEFRSPQKTSHTIARQLNYNEESPFFKKLKMLGKKENDISTLSQGAFINGLLPLISQNPDDDLRKIKLGQLLERDLKYPLRDFFIHDRDDLIYKTMFNIFNALKEVMPKELENGIFSKTVGYGGLMKALNPILKVGIKIKNLKQEFFKEGFINFRNKNHDFSKYTSNSAQETELSKLIINSFKERYFNEFEEI